MANAQLAQPPEPAPFAQGLILDVAGMLGSLATEQRRIETEAESPDCCFSLARLRYDELTAQGESLRRALADAPQDAEIVADLLICEAERLSIEGLLKP